MKLRPELLHSGEFPRCEKCIFSSTDSIRQGTKQVFCDRYPRRERDILLKNNNSVCGEGQWMMQSFGISAARYTFEEIFDNLYNDKLEEAAKLGLEQS